MQHILGTKVWESRGVTLEVDMIMKCFKKVEFELLLERLGKAYPNRRGAEKKVRLGKNV